MGRKTKTKDESVVSAWIKKIVDLPGYKTPTEIASHLGVSITRVREVLVECPYIQPAATVAIYGYGEVAEIRRMVFGLDDEDVTQYAVEEEDYEDDD